VRFEVWSFLQTGFKAQRVKCKSEYSDLPLYGGIRPESFPFCFGKDQMYQLIESQDGEDWKLRVTDIRL
jgi:hypothetical protein